MPKQLINTIGLLIVLGIVAAGVMLVALPIYLQSLSVEGQARTVAASNDIQQAQVDALSQQDASEIEDSLGELTDQIPGSPRLDTVSALVTDAAAATGASVMSFTPGAETVFTPGAPADANAPTSTDDAASAEAATGTVQIPVQVTVTAPDLPSMVAFLDTLREGPRLLGNVQAVVSTRNGGADATIDALAFAFTTSAK